MRKADRIGVITVGFIVGVLLVALLVLTQTRWGRERVRLFGLGQLEKSIHGVLRVGEVRGNLLTGMTLIDVTLTDSAGRPFLDADTLRLAYSLRSLYQKHLTFHDVRLVNAVVVLDQQPGERWNFEKLFQADTVKLPNDTIPGFGSWIRFQDMEVVNADITVRSAWAPPAHLQGAERAAFIRRSLSSANRQWIAPAGSGYQSVATFRDVYGFLPLVRLADPDSATRIVDIARLRMTAMPFRPPAASVQDARGRITFGDDTVGFHHLRVRLPATQARLDGWYSTKTRNFNVRADGKRVSFPDLRFAYPRLPSGGGKLQLAVARVGNLQRIIGSGMDVRVKDARLAGSFDVQTGAIQRIGGSNLRFTDLDTRLIEQLAPNVHVPVSGVLTGHVRLAGVPDRLDVDGWTSIRDRAGQTSRIVADGLIGNGPAGTFARDLSLRFQPLRLSLVESFAPDVPINGMLTGRARLNGNLSGLFDVDADLVHQDARTGRSRIAAKGGMRLANGFRARNLHLRFDPLQLALVRAFQPSVKLDGQVTGRATLTGALASGFDVDADIVHRSDRTGRSHVLAQGGIDLRGGGSARRLRLRFDPLQFALVRAFAPRFDLDGVVSGRTTLTGSLARGFDVDADLVHSSAATGRSHVLARGGILLKNGFTARNLRLGFDPLQVALVRQFDPTLPLDGVIRGDATINGSRRSRLAATLAIVHEGSTGTSRVNGEAALAFGGGRVQHVDVNVRGRPFALATLGRFAPAAGLRGTATGSLIARGSRNDIAFTTDLAVADGGAIFARGTLALAQPLRYDITSRLTAFDPAAVSTRAPVAHLTGTVLARGTGTQPATMNAFIDASLIDSRVPGAPQLDSTRIRARLANGLAQVERGHIRLASAVADIQGSFGLVAGRYGELRYDIAIDTLSQVTRLSTDTTLVQPRPLQQQRHLAAARADSVRVASATEVERAATGKPPAPRYVVDTLPPLRRDSIAGSLKARGVLSGNIKQFGAKGTADFRNFVFRGNAVRDGHVGYDVANAPTPQMSAHLDGSFTGVRTGGFAFDSARVVLDHRGGRREGNGTIDLALFQDPDRDYRLKSDFVLALDRKEVRLNDLVMRFDTTTWKGTRPGRISWAKAGIELDEIDLVDNHGGHIYADGRIPNEGSGDLRLDLDRVQLGDIAALLQDTLDTRGLISLHARVRGTSSAPGITGNLALDSASRAGKTLPTVRSEFQYADRLLTGTGQALANARTLLDANFRLPIDLALSNRSGPRLLDRPLSVEARADSFPLDALPSFTTAVTDVSGVLAGNISIKGTIHDPQLSGVVNLGLGSAYIPQPGITLRDGVATLRLQDDKLYVDSLVAQSGGGPVRVAGTVDLSELTRPAFDLDLTARNALLLNGKRGNIRADVALDITGPFEKVSVTGDVNVKRGVIYVNDPRTTRRTTNLDAPTLVPVLDTLHVAPELRKLPPPILRNLQLNVAVRVQRDTWVRNPTANVEIYTEADADPLRITANNALQTIVVEGTINADRGEYTLAGRQFTLTTGSVTFLGTPEPDPLLQLSAQYEVPRRNREALIIQIAIGGYLSEPRISLSSNSQPPLPESDLISFLAFGRSSSSLLEQNGSGITGGALGILAEQQLAGLGIGAVTDVAVAGLEKQGTRAGLDVFRIRPAPLPDELNFGGYFQNIVRGMEFEAGKYLNPRLYLSARGRSTALPGLRLEFQRPDGLGARFTWEPQYMPAEPTLAAQQVTQRRVLGAFLLYLRRF